jgi:hypothetical protein
MDKAIAQMATQVKIGPLWISPDCHFSVILSRIINMLSKIKKAALIIGATGQDGAYVAELLFSEGSLRSTASNAAPLHSTPPGSITSIKTPVIRTCACTCTMGI